MKRIALLSVALGLLSVSSHAADVSDILRQFTAPCEFSTLAPERAQIDVANEMRDYVRQGFKLVSLTKVEKPNAVPNYCVYTFIRQ